MTNYIPSRGDLVWVDFNPSIGSEQKGIRPALVLTPTAYNEFGLCYILPITSVIKGYRIEVPLTSNQSINGVILTNQLCAMNHRAHNMRFVEKIDPLTLKNVDLIIKTILSL